MSDYKDLDGKWQKGISSLYGPSFIEQGEYYWLLNGDNSGGVISPRQGYSSVGNLSASTDDKPKGLTIFKDFNGQINLFAVIGDKFYTLPYPFKGDWQVVSGDGFTGDNPVIFCRAYKSTELYEDGHVTNLPGSYPVLVMQDGVGQARTWIGAGYPVTALSSVQADPPPSSDPATISPYNIPIGTWMQWSGDRLWVATGQKLHASDLGDPLHWYEETYIAGGGALFFSDDITGLNQTNNLQSLLVGTGYDISAVQSNVTDRTQWAQTPGFQQVIIPGIGVAAGKSFCRQWGMVWWYSQGGLIALDQALNTYRTSVIQYQDQGMLKQKSKLAKDLSGIVVSSFSNFLVAAVPYASKDNSQIWILNQRPIDTAQPTIAEAYRVPVWSSAWNGINPADMTLAVVKGRQRLFALSFDKVAQAHTVWELFSGERRDRKIDIINRPPVVFATRMLLMSDDLKKFEYADLDFSEMSGVVDVTVMVGGRKGALHTILSKRVVASRGNINAVISTAAKGIVQSSAPAGSHQIVLQANNDFNAGDFLISDPNSGNKLRDLYIRGQRIQYSAYDPSTRTFVCTPGFDVMAGDQVVQPQFTPSTIFESFKPQTRMLRTQKWTEFIDRDCQGCPTESNLNDRIDRGFQLVVQWTGQATLEGIRAYASKYADPNRGKCEADELTARSLSQVGCATLSPDVLESEGTTSGDGSSQMLPVYTSRIFDVEYHSDPSTATIGGGK